jgi:acyl dehydratase
MDNYPTIANRKILPFAAVTQDATAEVSVVITEELIYRFAEMTGDANPLHTDPNFGVQTPFGQINAQGQLMSSLIVGVIGSKLPGPGWFCLGVDATFVQPCFVGDRVVADVRVRQRIEALKVVVWDGGLRRLSDNKVLVRAVIKTKCML